MKRVALYIPEEDYLKLRSYLVLEKTTVSDWARKAILKFIAKREKKYGRQENQTNE